MRPLLTALGLASLVACRFGGPTGDPLQYVGYPEEGGEETGDEARGSQEDGGGQVSQGDDTTMSAADDADIDALDDASDDGVPGPPPGEGGACLPSTCPSTGCAFLTTPCCNTMGMCGCGYNDAAASCI
jgi:hypothetical protein